MEFLVRVRVRFPADMGPEVKKKILEAERDRGADHRATGHLIRTWRVPGRPESISLWRTPNPTALHDLMAELPVYPYSELVEVEALAEHPIDPQSHEAPPLRTA